MAAISFEPASNLSATRFEQVRAISTCRDSSNLLEPGRRQHISATVRDMLHWLSHSIVCKMALMAFDCVQGQGPECFHDVLVSVYCVEARAHYMGSDVSSPRIYNVQCTSRHGRRSFHSPVPTVWNHLPC